MSPKHIAVIGAGHSGLSAIKACLEEHLSVTCYEKTTNFGGAWRYRDEITPGTASIMKSTVSVHSKDMNAFSDFPPSSEFPTFLHHSKMVEYLGLYASRFGLLRHVKFEEEVVNIHPAASYEKTGKWRVTSVNKTNGANSTEEFDGVMVCSGRRSHPHVPTLPNQSRFKGKILHTHSLRTVSEFEDQNVLVVGIGNSAVEAAVEISTLAKQVYLSTRKGAWIFPKLGPKGLPFDMTYRRRYLQSYSNDYIEKHVQSKMNHQLYRLKPSYKPLDVNPTVSEDLPDKVLTGRVLIKGEVSDLEESAVTFYGEEEPTKIDSIILGTGYEAKFPFLDDKLPPFHNGKLKLYKNVFPIDIQHTTLSIIGFTQCNGPPIPISENQSRWAARVLSNKVTIPSKQFSSDMVNTICYMKYMDEVAAEYGVKPNVAAMFFKDLSLWWSCFTGPLVPYQYRLFGPHVWSGARGAIVESSEGVSASLHSNLAARKANSL